MSLFFILLFIGITAAVAAVFVTKIAEEIQNDRAPQEQTRAQVVQLQRKDDTSMMPMGADGAMMPVSNTVYEVIFRTQTGETKKYRVKAEAFRSMQENQIGTLCFQGTRFLGFEPD